MNRTPFIAANWKMNLSVNQGLGFITHLLQQNLNSDREVLVCPPYTSLHALNMALEEQEQIKLGAQNCHEETNGAFTGEISAFFLKDIGCSYVLLGHSERRHVFGESNELIGRKLRTVLSQDMIPILCVGETQAQREGNHTMAIIHEQLKAGLDGLSAEDLQGLVIAYEPFWAIGTGLTAKPEQAQEVHEQIRLWLSENTEARFGDETRILYGGSVKSENISELMAQNDIDGALVGGA